MLWRKRQAGFAIPEGEARFSEAYELGNRPGWTVILQSGRCDGFSPCDVDFFLDVGGDVCEELGGYTFENVPRFVDHFGCGDFASALGP